MQGTLRPMDMTWGAGRALMPALVALALTLVSCTSTDSSDSSDSTQTTMTSPSSASTTVPTDDESGPVPVNAEVTDRARAALTSAGAQRLVLVPGYEREVNTGFQAVWRGESLTAYVVPTSALPPTGEPGELRVLGRRQISGQVVEVVLGQHSTVRMLRFKLGPDTWLVTELDPRTTIDAFVGALLS